MKHKGFWCGGQLNSHDRFYIEYNKTETFLGYTFEISCRSIVDMK